MAKKKEKDAVAKQAKTVVKEGGIGEEDGEVAVEDVDMPLPPAAEGDVKVEVDVKEEGEVADISG